MAVTILIEDSGRDEGNGTVMTMQTSVTEKGWVRAVYENAAFLVRLKDLERIVDEARAAGRKE